MAERSPEKNSKTGKYRPSCPIDTLSEAGPDEVECDDCALDPMCRILDYNEGENRPPEGILLRRQAVKRGETLFWMGDPFRSIFAVKAGSFKTLVPLEQEGERVIGIHLPGELIGAEALSARQYSCTARALEPGSVCELRMARLEESGRAVEVLQRGVIELLGREVAFSHALTSSLIRQSGEQRVAAFLLNLSGRLDARGMRGAEFTLQMSRSDMASYLGLAGETVSRLLTKFQKSGALTIRHKRVCLKDRELLERFAVPAEGRPHRR
jgi:CRP/FNR family transcriptional regulator